MRETDDHVYPVEYVMRLWEELQAAWVERLRESRRELLLKLGTDNPRKEDLKALAMAPDSAGNPSWKFPNTFDLDAPDGYFQEVCVPRQMRAVRRLLFNQLYQKSGSPKAGGQAEPSTEEDSVVGNAVPKRGGPPPKRKPGITGKRLSVSELRASLKHAPKNAAGKFICWNHTSHLGCQRGAKCPHAHEVIKSTADLHWTVQAQLLRQGGLRKDRTLYGGRESAGSA